LTDTHLRYVKQFEEAEEQGAKGARPEAEKARDYFDTRQFTAEEEAALKKRKQPITPENLIKPKVQALCGLERQSRTDPHAWPRTQQHQQDAEAATDALRYVSDDQDLDIKVSRAFENMLVEGECGVEVTVRKLKDGAVDPRVIHVAWDRLYGDPHSREADRSDASYVGYITWMDVEQAKLKWPKKKDVIEASVAKGTSSSFDTYEDKPSWATWYDGKRKRLRVNTHYHLESGVWHKCVFTLSGELEESKPSVFIDDEGNPECPLIMQGAYVDRDNDRYGIVRDMIPLQDEVNKRRSKFLHMINNAKVRVSPSVGQDKEKIRAEMARPDGVIVGEQGEVEELGNAGREAGQFQLLMDSRQTLKGNLGPNAHMQGKGDNDQSGRAILAQQQAGMIEMTPLLDNLRHLKLRIFRQIWNRIRQYWTAERWIRVTDDESNVRFVGLNVTRGALAMQKVEEAAQAGEIPPEMVPQYQLQIQMDPQMQLPANNVAELDVDIDIDEVAETPSLQIEQFEQITQVMGTGVFGTPPHPEMVKLWIMASNLRDKQKMLELIDQMQQQAAQPNPMAEQMQQIQVAGAQAAVAETESKAALNAAKAQTEAAKPMMEGFKAGAAGI
jgi:hypothetical protein